MEYLPIAIVCAIGFVILYFLNIYRKDASLRDYYNKIIEDGKRAETDEAFRKEQIADAEQELAKHPKPDPVEPINKNYEIHMQLFPSLAIGCVAGCILSVGHGMYDKEGADANLYFYVSLAMLAACAVLIVFTERAKKKMARIRQINRLNLLYKAAGNNEGVESTLREMIQYYPGVPALRLELANQIALRGKVDEAVSLLKIATAAMPDDIGKALVDLSFFLNWKAFDDAQKVVDRLPELATMYEDARPDLYAGVLEFAKGNREKAKEFVRKAVEADSSFVDYSLGKDKMLASVAPLVEEVYEDLRRERAASGESDDDNGEELEGNSDSEGSEDEEQ